MEQERERMIERLGKRQALYTRLYLLYVASGVEKAKLRGHLQSTAYFRRCALSSVYRSFYGHMRRRGLPLSELFDPTFSFSWGF